MTIFSGPGAEPVHLTVHGSSHVTLTASVATTITPTSVFGTGSFKYYMIQSHPSNTSQVFWGGSTVTNSNGTYLDATTILAWDHVAATLFGYTTGTTQKVIVTGLR